MAEWVFRNIDKIGKNVKKNEKCFDMYRDLDNTPIPIFTEDLKLQMKIEQFAVNCFVRGYKKAESKGARKISSLTHQNKINLERIKGLEAMVKEYQDERCIN